MFGVVGVVYFNHLIHNTTFTNHLSITMQLSPSTIAELRSTERNLISRIRNAKQEIEKLQQDQVADIKQLQAIRQLLPSDCDTAKSSELKLSSDAPFRDNLRAVVRHLGRPVKPAEARKALEDAGIESPGSTDYTTRVSNELYRLADSPSSPIEKTEDGYLWKDDSNNEPEEGGNDA